MLPKVAGCVLVDRFPDGTEVSEDDRQVSPVAALQRLAPVVRREGWRESRFALVGTTGAWRLASGEDLRETPALAVYSAGTFPDVDGERESLIRWMADLRSREGVQGVVGLASPALASEIAGATDILLVATPYISRDSFAEVIRPYATGLRPGALYGDVLSLKEQPLAVASEVLPKSVGIIGLHPLFGRAVVDPTGLVVTVAPAPDGRAGVRWERWLVNALAGSGLLLTPTSGAEHDAAMSYVQALTHFVLLSFAYTFVRANQDPTQLLPFRTPV
ncbi:MAG: prephenate dehydrogenase/arogenate dehydrogenase family protein, partial [Chloroflexi bacterium]|nr:prephenate dehydrogenase/arogenate dehydrogenase family protein [Chloroflexota bacterium]